MKFTDAFIQRPVLAIVISCLLLLLGGASLSKIGLRQFPELERSVIYVNTYYPGASARTVQGFVTTPLQVVIAGARGIEYMSSESNPGESNITIYVRLGEDSNNVLNEVIAKVSEARGNLPRDIEEPIVSATGGGDGLIWLGFYSEQMTLYQVTDFLLRSVQPELATLPGVGKANVFSYKLAMRIRLDPVRMAALGVTATDVNAAIQRDNFISAAGATEGNLVRVTVDARTTLQTEEEFRGLVVRQSGDERILLGDVADIELDSETDQVKTLSSGKAAVFLSITPTPDANPLEVSKAVHATLPKIEATLPADMEMLIDWDGSVVIDEAIGQVLTTLFEASDSLSSW